jgi:error-prone DNA polymerase
VPGKVLAILTHELRLIEKLRYAPYFLTVNAIVRFARSQDILCQGRGSAANSAVCYVLGITSIDPECNDLLFENFVSEERHEPPDIREWFNALHRKQVAGCHRERCAACATFERAEAFAAALARDLDRCAALERETAAILEELTAYAAARGIAPPVVHHS